MMERALQICEWVGFAVFIATLGLLSALPYVLTW